MATTEPAPASVLQGAGLPHDEVAAWVSASPAEGAGFDPALVVREDGPEELSTALSSKRGIMLRRFDAALADYLAQVSFEQEAAVAAE